MVFVVVVFEWMKTMNIECSRLFVAGFVRRVDFAGKSSLHTTFKYRLNAFAENNCGFRYSYKRSRFDCLWLEYFIRLIPFAIIGKYNIIIIVMA